MRALTRVASGENEGELLELARHATAAQLERVVRGYRAASALADDARRAHEAREVFWWHEDDGSLVIQARLPAPVLVDQPRGLGDSAGATD